MVRACPNQNVTLAYLVCVHVAVREPIHRDLLSPSTLWVLRLSICPAICTLACPSICLSAGLFCAICLPIFVPHCSFTCLSWPSSCPVDPLSPSVCLPSPCTPVFRISLLVPLHPYFLHLCIRSCVPLFVWSTPPASVSSLSSIPIFPSTSVALTASDVPCLLSSGDALLTPTG